MIVTLKLISFKAKLYELSYQSNDDVHSINKVLFLYSMYSFANLADGPYIKKMFPFCLSNLHIVISFDYFLENIKFWELDFLSS